ncbi:MULTISPECIES: endonuclease domain-containing protein [unclassified Burkholderia]|uniref:endonuclease domain-containing protein n=1 Tax=unclassified Burkholderia TaxID=2613784 RepID=UPI000F56BCF1|nr:MULTISPECIES: DUF559 domain-containing protein [unclassified Burkholderia]RQR87692.1 DUF559 domain-containing protein [Burkholderia sp. Bp9011]RQR97038.1 DUF559 domain-containing protein [Burkholderia sp. Bp9010]
MGNADTTTLMQLKDVKLPDAVAKLITDGAAFVARSAIEHFKSEMTCNCVEVGLESPIEMAMWVALHTVAQVNQMDWNDITGVSEFTGGLDIIPQYRVGRYRADFLVVFYGYGARNADKTREVIVECDGTAFHERTEAERRHEKARDRFFQKKGYKVFRYTGSEILKRPYEIAAEILNFVDGDMDSILTPQEYLNV